MACKGKYERWLTKEGLLLLSGWARDGLTDEQIASNMGISRSTLNEWKNKFSDISDTLKINKEIADYEVENALRKRALGYEYTEVTKERIIDTGQKKRHEGEQELTEKEWAFTLAYFGHRCAYCGEFLIEPTKDHIKPRIDGGKLEQTNIIPACRSCNSSKKDNEMLSWFQSQPFYDPKRAEKISDYVSLVSFMKSSEYEGDMIVTKEVTKQVAPDTTAQIFWLKNRQPDKWRSNPQPGNDELLDKLDSILGGIDAIANE